MQLLMLNSPFKPCSRHNA